MLPSIKNNIKNDICNNALDAVTMGYNEGRFLAPLRTNLIFLPSLYQKVQVIVVYIITIEGMV